MSEKTKKRNEVENIYKWKVEDIFKDVSEWEKEYDYAIKNINIFDQYKNQLGTSSVVLLKCLENLYDYEQKVTKIYVYSFLRFYEDTTNMEHKAISDKASTLGTKFSAAVSFINPEIISLGEDKIKNYLETNKSLHLYKHILNDIIRQSKYILSEKEEEILAKAGEIANGPDDIFTMFHDSDLKFGTIKNEMGEEVELTFGNYISFMESKNREVRKNAYEKMYDQISKYKNTFSATYAASVAGDNFFADVKKYNSALEMGLFSDNIPKTVYDNLVNVVHEYLPHLHKYINLRKKALGYDKLYMYDIYTPIIKEATTVMNYADAQKNVIEALKPLGSEYCEGIKKSFIDGWIDVYENEGKRSGAFQWGVYDCHPFVCLNYSDKIDDMFTLSHELGHAMHSHYTWKTQPFAYGDYPIFLAEVASTVNEALLIEHMLKTSDDKTMQKYLINYFLEMFRGTVFRQTMFAEFEAITHTMAKNDEPLTSESLSRVYLELNKKYYGDEIELDDRIAYEWARIPHFYNAFYVYKYATGFSIAIAFSKIILEGDSSDLEKYIGFLKSGSSDYPIEILKKAGVDITTPKPIKDALDVFVDLVTKLEKFI